MNLTRITDAESEAVTLTEVKNQLRIGSGSENDQSFNLFIAAIRHKTETFLGKTLITSKWSYKIDKFCGDLILPMGPVQSVESITYIDTNGDEQTFDDYQFDRAGRLKPSYGFSWPDTREQFDAVTIDYTAGESEAKPDIKLAMLLWVGACDINREDNQIAVSVSEIPNGAKSALMPYRDYRL